MRTQGNLKRAALAAVVAVLVLAIAGCSTQSSIGETPSASPPTRTASAPPTYPPTAGVPTRAATLVAPPAGITSSPTAGTTPAGRSLVVLQAPNNDIVLVDAAGNSRVLLAAAPHFNETGVASVAGAAPGTLYALAAEQQGATYQIYAVDAQGARPLNLGPTDGYGLAVWPGKDPATTLLSWGLSDLTTTPTRSQLFSAAAADAQGTAAVDESRPEPRLLVPLKWSQDGKRLYFSKEPTGFGGYILFSGASSLWVWDRGSVKANMLVDEGQAGGLICMDDLSPDEQLLAHACVNKMLTLLDITTGKSTPIQPPAGLPAFEQLGSARFSPDGQRVAYAIALGNPDQEQGWAALSDGLQGGSKVIATSEPGEYYNVKGWLDDQTVILQSYGSAPAIWLVKAGGGSAQRVADGSFLAVMQP